MEFINKHDLLFHLLEQMECWHYEDMLFTLQHFPKLREHLNSLTFFELDTKEADRHIEEWLNTSKRI